MTSKSNGVFLLRTVVSLFTRTALFLVQNFSILKAFFSASKPTHNKCLKAKKAYPEFLETGSVIIVSQYKVGE